MTFAERLTFALQVTGKRRVDICNATGFSQANLSHFTTGQREPSLESLARLLEALPEVDARWLITGKEQK